MVPTRDKNWFCQNTLTGKNKTTVQSKKIDRKGNQVLVHVKTLHGVVCVVIKNSLHLDKPAAFETNLLLIQDQERFIFTFADRLLRIIVTLWPWTWMQSIEIIGFPWVIGYFFYHLLRFAAMDERTLER